MAHKVTFRSLASRLSALFRRRELDDRVDEELEFHLRMQIEENIRRGMAPTDARIAARREIGNTTQVCEEVHRMNTIEFLDETVRNFRLSFRTLRRSPGFALTAVLVLALGLGASTAMFSALDRILFRSLPYADADRLVNLGWTMWLHFPRQQDTGSLCNCTRTEFKASRPFGTMLDSTQRSLLRRAREQYHPLLR